jgi:hypothetical protein
LVTTCPEHADYHHRLAGNLNNISNLIDAISSTDASLWMERALHHELIAMRLNPEHRQYQRFASIQYANLAGHWEKQNEERTLPRHRCTNPSDQTPAIRH